MKTKLLLTLSIFCFFSATAQFGEQQVISTSTEKPYLSIPFDIDNDGYTDVLTASGETYNLSWYRNLDGTGNFEDEITINETPVFYLSVDFIDMNNDGKKDILYLSNNPRYIAWLENLDGAGNFGPEQILAEMNYISSVIPIDMDNDGDQDLVAIVTNTFSSRIVWHENLDGLGTFSEEKLLIQNTDELSKILVVDIDNDGLLDILASDFVLNRGKIFWYKNLGNSIFAEAQTIYQFEYLLSGGTNIIDFRYIDINTDGKKDLVISAEDEYSINTYWLENLDVQGNFGNLQLIMNTDDRYLFYDLDNDNDNDLLLWNTYTNKITWRENEDGQGNFNAPVIITTEVDFSMYDGDAKAADFDGDGWLDIASASPLDNKLAWYKNNTLGISQNEVANYLVYPNPTDALLNIMSKQPIYKISVFDILGQLLETNRNANQIDLSKVNAGVYFLEIEDENGNSQTQKIMKK